MQAPFLLFRMKMGSIEGCEKRASQESCIFPKIVSRLVGGGNPMDACSGNGYFSLGAEKLSDEK
jgi:hypothetical protein